MQEYRNNQGHTHGQESDKIFLIEPLLPVGKENRISSSELVRLAGCGSNCKNVLHGNGNKVQSFVPAVVQDIGVQLIEMRSKRLCELLRQELLIHYLPHRAQKNC